MTLSFIIIHFNTPALTSACLDSILAFSGNIPSEILVVDNGSEKKATDDLEAKFPGVRFIRNPSNSGYAKAANTGISSARGEYILLLNSDVTLNASSVTTCLEGLQSHKDAGLVACRITYPDGRLQRNCQSFPSITKELFELSRLIKLLPYRIKKTWMKGPFFRHDEQMKGGWLWGTFLMFRKADLARLAGQKLSERFFMYGEDLEWAYQFRQAGFKALFLPNAAVIHHSGGSEYSSIHNLSGTIIKNELEFIRTYYGRPYLYVYRKIKKLKLLSLAGRDRKYRELAAYY